MDFLPFASITADKAMRRHFDGARLDRSTVESRDPHEPAASTSPSFHGAAAFRARVAGLLYRGARAVEPCGYRQPATR